MGFSLHERGFRAGFYGREPAEADPTYLEGYHAGLRDGDRTRARLGRQHADPNASGSLLVPAPDLGMQAEQEQGPPSAASEAT